MILAVNFYFYFSCFVSTVEEQPASLANPSFSSSILVDWKKASFSLLS